MNTQEAIKVLNGCHDICKDGKKDKYSLVRFKAIAMGISALKKQIPQKPTHKAYFYGRIFYCPSCEKSIDESLIIESNRYCRHCGQALDWDI